MNSRLTFSVLACVALAQAQSDQPTINTPQSIVQCLPSLLSFSGGTPPYTLSVLPGGQPGATPLADIGGGPVNGPSVTWKANVAAGTSITLQIRDSKGAINYAQAVTIQPSSDSSCLGSNGGSGTQPTPTSPNPPVTTSVSSTPPPGPTNTTPPAAGNNSTSGASGTANNTSPRTNSTVPPTGTNTTSTGSSSNNQTKGPSVFTPPSTTSLNNSSSAANNAPNSAAPSTMAHLSGLLTGLSVAGAALTLFA